jgi:hypothetical protein
MISNNLTYKKVFVVFVESRLIQLNCGKREEQLIEVPLLGLIQKVKQSMLLLL